MLYLIEHLHFSYSFCWYGEGGSESTITSCSGEDAVRRLANKKTEAENLAVGSRQQPADSIADLL